MPNLIALVTDRLVVALLTPIIMLLECFPMQRFVQQPSLSIESSSLLFKPKFNFSLYHPNKNRTIHILCHFLHHLLHNNTKLPLELTTLTIHFSPKLKTKTTIITTTLPKTQTPYQKSNFHPFSQKKTNSSLITISTPKIFFSFTTSPRVQ